MNKLIKGILGVCREQFRHICRLAQDNQISQTGKKLQANPKVCFIIKITMIISIKKATSPKPEQHQFTNQKVKVVIGRNPKSDDGSTLVVEQPSASRNHLVVKLKNKKISIMDLGSSNGTKVNEKEIEANQWIEISDQDFITLGDSEDKIYALLQPQDQGKQQNDQSDSESQSRSREKNKARKFQDLCKELKISDSSLKMLKQMTSQRKSKEQRIKLLKMMGCKNLQANWDQIEHFLKKQNKFTNTLKKANQDLEKQFSFGRAVHEKKGLGRK